jgi:subtilisin family serine protease
VSESIIAYALACFALGSSPASLPQLPNEPVTPRFETRARTSPPVRGIGARLAAKIRREGPGRLQHILVRGVDRRAIEAYGGRVTAELGPIAAAYMRGSEIVELARIAERIDSPQPLKPMLDISRIAIGADAADEGRDFDSRYRGRDVIIAAYDSGLDLAHPDLRELDGKSRVLALWDQTMLGSPPAGFSDGHECSKAALESDTCASGDPVGHGTHVLSIAAGNSPTYRGIAPDARVVLARSDDFELFVESLAWFRQVAERERLPMVVNISLGGHEGPHDGTSLEAQAIDAYPHLVVTAAGNEGTIPVHARATLARGATKHAALRFPVLRAPVDQRAIVEIWAPGASPPVVRGLIMTLAGEILAATASITAGDPGRTEPLAGGEGTTYGRVELDAEAEPNPLNDKSHVRLEVALDAWQDAPAGAGLFVVALEGDGEVDLWVDSPPDQPAPVSFDADGALELDSAIRGDTQYSVSDPATAVSALAVSAYTSRVEFPTLDGRTGRVSGSVGALASFSSYGPTLAPERTGQKPDLAAPGYIIVAAKSSSVPAEEVGIVSPLYRASAGTSMSAPHAAGTAALVIDAKPTATKFDLKQILLESASKDGADGDARWGAGKLDAEEAIALSLGLDRGCGCSTQPHAGDRTEYSGPILLVISLIVLRSCCRPRLRGKGPRVT